MKQFDWQGHSLRPLTKDDEAELHALVCQTEVGAYLRHGPHTDLMETHRMLLEYLLPQNHAFAVLDTAGEMQGVAVLKVELGETGVPTGNSHITVFLDPTLWNRGLSTRLVEWLCALGAEQGVATVTSYVMEANQGSLKVCQKNGFEEVASFMDDEGRGGMVYILQKKLVCAE